MHVNVINVWTMFQCIWVHFWGWGISFSLWTKTLSAPCSWNFYCDRWCLRIVMPWRHMKPTSEKSYRQLYQEKNFSIILFHEVEEIKFMGCFLKREEIVKYLWSCVFCKLNWAKFKFKTWWRPKKCLGIKGKCS